MRVIYQQPRDNLPEFSGIESPIDAEDVVVRNQGCFVAIIQMDGAGEDRHWVIVHRDSVEDFIEKVRRAVE